MIGITSNFWIRKILCTPNNYHCHKCRATNSKNAWYNITPFKLHYGVKNNFFKIK